MDIRKKRVVITGVGVVSPVGIGKDAFWQALREGRSGIKPITLFDTAEFKVKAGGEITDFSAKDILGKKGLVDLDRATTLLLSAARFALEDAGLEISEQNTRSTGISVGTTFGSLNSLSEFDRDSITEGPRFVNPSRFPNTVINSPASRLAIRHGVKGLNSTISTGFCAGLDAIDYGVHCLNFRRAERIIAGCVEEMCVQTFLGFYKLGYLSGLKDGPPVCCPFDRRRNGIVFAEGAACFILEELAGAGARKANIYAELLGSGSVFMPYRLHKYQPQGKGMAAAMRLALANAGLQPGEIDCIYANANSTPAGDSVETRAIKDVFAGAARRIPVTAVKSMLGETFSASGDLALAAALGSLRYDFIPATINYREPDPACDLDCVLNQSRSRRLNKIMINSFDPSGGNSVLIVGRY